MASVAKKHSSMPVGSWVSVGSKVLKVKGRLSVLLDDGSNMSMFISARKAWEITEDDNILWIATCTNPSLPSDLQGQ